jgi:hypothetical protein
MVTGITPGGVKARRGAVHRFASATSTPAAPDERC